MLRIIAGKHRTRKLAVPEGEEATNAIRPTKDRAREALFSMLQHRLGSFEEAKVLDGFAGTGALGLECLSRGAAHATFMDNSKVAIELIRRNAASLRENAKCAILHLDATTPPKAHEPCDLILLDPPYNQGLAEKALATLTSQGWAHPSTIAAIEVARDEDFTPPAGWTLVKDRPTAAAHFYILEHIQVASEDDAGGGAEIEEIEGLI